MKSFVLSVLENNDHNSPYFRDYYVDYLITKRINETKSDYDSIYNYLNDKFYGQAVIVKDALNYYLSTNFDIDSNGNLIINNKQKIVLEDSIKKIYEFNFEEDMDKLADEVVTSIKKREVEDLIENDFIQSNFKKQLVNVLAIYKKTIYDYKNDFFAAVYYNTILKKDVYASLIDEFLLSSKKYDYDINIADIFNNKALIKLFKIYRIKYVNELMDLEPDNLVLLFPIDFKLIIDTLNIIPSRMYNTFINKTVSFVDKLKDNYLVIIKERIIGNKTLQETGDKLGITRERTRQIETKMIRNICEIYNQENRDFISNVYTLLNSMNKPYLKSEKYFKFFNNENVKTALICYLKYSQKSIIKYDYYYHISKK